MINAILASTNTEAPWAAYVDFDVNGAKWTVTLNTKYTHYKNLLENNQVVIVYKTPLFEIIAKGAASLPEANEDQSVVAIINLNWLRLVENGNVTDSSDFEEIEKVINSRI